MRFKFLRTANRLVLLSTVLSLSYAAPVDAGAPVSERASLDLDRDIGLFAAARGQQFCLSIKNARLKAGQAVTLIWLPIAGGETAEIGSTTVRKMLARRCDSINSVPGDAAYALKASKLDTGKIYIAIVGKHNLRRVRGTVEGKLDSRGSVTFRACSSMEGLHFSAWSGSVPRREKIWQRYYYLGYDVEPTCNDADFND